MPINLMWLEIKMRKKVISVVGLGYIGLPTAAMFAQAKTKVIGVDVVPHVVDTINQGKIHIVEPGLEEIVQRAVRDGYLRASLTAEPADAFLIAVPTPFKADYEPDLSYIESAAQLIAPVIKKGDIIILESTSPVGATEQMVAWLRELRSDLEFPSDANQNPDVYVAYCPERVLPGKVIEELINNDRVIGGLTPKCALLAESVYRIFVKGQLLHTNARTAEMSKLTENSFRDVNIAFANELSMICDKLDINVWELISLANHHPRVNILQPGPGVGGHCIAVDPWFIIHKTPIEAKLIRAARGVNDNKSQWVISQCCDKIENYLGSSRKMARTQMKIACMGVTFKPDVSDLRNSPALLIFEALSHAYPNQVFAVDPICETNQYSHDLTIDFWQLNEAILNADVFIFLVKHTKFYEIAKLIPFDKVVLDYTGILEQSSN